jgi:hypothetical protein
MYRIAKEIEMTNTTQTGDTPNPWDADEPVAPEKTKSKKSKTDWVVTPEVKAAPPVGSNAGEYDMDGLMTDFPTAKELERFVFDETGIVLNLKGRANKLKYQTAMDALNGETIDAKFIGDNNPYIDKTDMVPVEPMPPIPDRDPGLPPFEEVQNYFFSPFVPHPDPDFRAVGKKCHCTFRKYTDGTISYEINGPWEQKETGTKIDKYGRERPEIIKWIGAATGEQMVQREDGTLTPVGRRLRTMMQAQRINAGNIWDTFVDRDFGQFNSEAIVDPWGTDTRV